MSKANEKFVLGAVIGYLCGKAAGEGDKFFAIGFGVLITLYLAVAAYDAYKERKKRREAKKLLSELDVAMNDLLGLITPLKLTADKQFHTISGVEATDDVKTRGFLRFQEETNGDEDTWKGMPEFARESWYRDVEEEDRDKPKETDDAGQSETQHPPADPGA